VIAQVRNDIRKYRMLEGGERVVVAVSGGADSLALLAVLHQLAGEFALQLIVAHFHHGLRAEADQEAELVRKRALAWGWPYELGKGDVKAAKMVHKGSWEDTARRLRYRFLDETAQRYGATKIALGHHRQDQAETVLLHLLRGCALEGLKGMSPMREGKYIRPLLFRTPQEIHAFLAREGLRGATDTSNYDDRFLRNRIRHRLIPLLERDFNSRIVDTLVQMAEILGDEDAFLVTAAQAAMPLARTGSLSGSLSYPLQELKVLPLALRRRVVKQLLEGIKPAGSTIMARHIAEVLGLIDRYHPSGQVVVPGGIVRREYDCLTVVGRAHRPSLPREFCFTLPMPGEVRIALTGEVVRATFCSPEGILPAPRDPRTLYLSLKNIEGPLMVRNWRFGDRMQPLGMEGTKKVQDILGEGKVPRYMRPYVPILADRAGILWVGGVKLAERCRLREDDSPLIKIEIV